jgi:hypothetical protein
MYNKPGQFRMVLHPRVEEIVDEPVNEPKSLNAVVQPLIQSAIPVTQPVTQPVMQPVTQPVMQPTIRPPTQPVVKQSLEDLIESVANTHAQQLAQKQAQKQAHTLAQTISQALNGGISEEVNNPWQYKPKMPSKDEQILMLLATLSEQLTEVVDVVNELRERSDFMIERLAQISTENSEERSQLDGKIEDINNDLSQIITLTTSIYERNYTKSITEINDDQEQNF